MRMIFLRHGTAIELPVPADRTATADLFSSPGPSLLAIRRRRQSALDVQHRKSAPGDRSVSKSSGTDSRRSHLDDSRLRNLVPVRAAGEWQLLFIDAGACRRN